MISTLHPALTFLLWTSLYATLLAVAVVLSQPLLRRIPARWRFALWLLVLVRFLPIPLPHTSWSPFAFLPQPAPASVEPASPVPPASPAAPLIFPENFFNAAPAASPLPATVTPSTVVNPSHAPAPPPARSWVQLPTLLHGLYLLGVCLVALRFLLSMLALRRLLARGQRTMDPALLKLLDDARTTLAVRRHLPLLLIADDHLSSPALVGLLRPRLLLPRSLAADLAPDQLRLVFLHECAHLRRHDIAANYLLALVACLHWFNPALWLLMPRIRADRELATDELVLAHADPTSYGHALLSLAERTSSLHPALTPAVGILETKSSFIRRIHMIAAFRRHPAWVAALAATGLLLTAACTLTSPATRAADPKPAGAAAIEAPAKPTQATLTTTGNTAVITGNVNLTTDSAASSADQDALAKLDIPLKEVSFDNVSLSNIIEFLRDRTGANILVRWKVLENAGIDRNAAVSLKLGDIPARVALTRVLDDAGGTVRLGYDVSDGIITISTQDDILATAKTTTQIYNVRDLLQQMTPNVTIAGGGPDGQPVTATESPYSDTHTAALTKVIQNNVSPALWNDNGGHLGSITTFDGLFTITATPTMHAQVADILARLRAAAKESAKPQTATPAPRSAIQPPPVPNTSSPESVRRVYDVHRLIDVPATQTGPLNQDQRNAIKDLESSITSLLDTNARVTSVNGMLIVSTTKEGQDQVEKLIIELSEHHAQRMDEAQEARDEELARRQVEREKIQARPAPTPPQ